MAQQETLELPKGWTNTTIGEVCNKPIQRKPEDDESFHYIDIGSVNRSAKTIEGASEITGKDAPSRARKIVDEGDVIVSMTRPNLNAVAKINSEYSGQVASTGFDVLKPILVEPDWIFSTVKSEKFIQAVSGITQGALYPACKAADIRNFEFGLPPLPEQKRIVEKLDSLLAQVDTIQQRLNNLPDIIKRFRQSVLAAGVSGKLTEQWRLRIKQEQVDIRSYSEEFKSKVSSRKKYKFIERAEEYVFDVPSSWAITAIGNLSVYQQGMQIAKSTRRERPEENTLPILRTVNYESNFEKDIHYAVLDEKSIVAEPEDIIISRTGTVGRVLTGFKGIMHNNSFRMLFDKQSILREYLIVFIESPICQEYIRENSGRSSQPDLTHTAFSKCPISIPLLEEQTEIVRLVEQYFALADTLEKNLANTKQRVDNLTQSILAKAFKGELVPQDPNDEPADKLLERIKTARVEAEKLEKAAKKAAKAKKK